MRTWKFGDNIDTDAIIPGRYLVYNDPVVLASHAFEGTRNDFAKGVAPGMSSLAGGISDAGRRGSMLPWHWPGQVSGMWSP